MTISLILRNIFELFSLHIENCQNLKDNISLLNKLGYLQSKFTKPNYFLDDNIKNFTEKINDLNIYKKRNLKITLKMH